MASAHEIATLLSLTERRVQQLAAAGIIPKSAHGQYEIHAVVKGYIGFLKYGGATDDGDGEAIDFRRERARKMRADANRAELDYAVARNQVATVEEFEIAMTTAYSKVRGALRMIPPRCASKIGALKDEAKIAGIILAEVDKALEALADAELVTEDDLKLSPEGTV